LSGFVYVPVVSFKLKEGGTQPDQVSVYWILENYCSTDSQAIPASVSVFFIDIKSFRSHYGPGVDSVSNRNEYQEHFLGVKAVGA